MAEIAQIHPAPATFDDLWDIWKSMGRRVGNAQARALYEQITSGGMDTTSMVDGHRVALRLVATPEEIMEGAKAYRDMIIRTDTEVCFTKTLPVWLNQARYEDWT